MNSKYPLIAAAVSAALAISSLAHAQPPSLTAAENPAYSLVIAGSSAAKSSISAAIGNDLCGGSTNMTTFSSTGASTNFFAYSCVPSTNSANSVLGSLVNGTNVFTIYYRDEGGSVTGALPLASTIDTASNPSGVQGLQQLLRLNLASCTGSAPTYSCAITCSNPTSSPAASVCGTVDSWAGATVSDHVQLGVTDVEPAQLVGDDYPSKYVAANFGSATAAQLAGLSDQTFVDQVFGVFINTEGTSITSTNLSKETYANILLGANPGVIGYTDWSQVPDALTGAPMASSTQKIIRIDREPGSGTRTSANLYFLSYPCVGGAAGIVDSKSEVDNYSTSNELSAVEATPGAVAYASIDNWYGGLNSSGVQTEYTNLALATINGVFPSNQAAAGGAYDYWFEATTVSNPSSTVVSTTTASIISWIQQDMPQIGSVPDAADILAIPGIGATPNVATVPLTNNGQTGTKEAYINPYTRGGHSCNVPAESSAG